MLTLLLCDLGIDYRNGPSKQPGDCDIYRLNKRRCLVKMDGTEVRQ